jgi:hypothetical protein
MPDLRAVYIRWSRWAAPSVDDWITDFASSSIFGTPPGAEPPTPRNPEGKPWGSIQHFDVWSFASNDRSAALALLNAALAALVTV